ncbi:hypothetical protein [Polluticoccus soli]|uniref:hypothetical protein n=1 Tax=Polluticoccus soli TaxID=3034150 RepID=UPI0023E2A337|nr:hypothetical protein [Flavipsychrobacter sp. JY13-12]
MRNVLLIVLVTVSLAACKKEYCWQCETDITTMVVTSNHDTTRIYDSKSDLLCNRTEKQIKNEEEKNSSETVTQDAGQSIYKKFKMTCKK